MSWVPVCPRMAVGGVALKDASRRPGGGLKAVLDRGPAHGRRDFRPGRRNGSIQPNKETSLATMPRLLHTLTDTTQYREAFALVEATFDGLPVNYCPYIFVDNDAALARGWAQGFPKKLGTIYQTRSFSAPSPAAAPLAEGSRFGASVAAHGERLATARVQLEERIADPSTVFKRPTTMRRYFPQLAAGRQDQPPVDELTMSLTDNLAIVDVWAGSAELRIPEVPGEDMHLIAPLRVGRGYRLGMAYSVTDLRILENYAS
jgi:hypothetical protein